ncbi:hypothetical protein [Fodinicola acaciae]|uniref:hypothetical protein n=1 Tax=Fodinicola acaciae TaxID=2681555 RepID=UPI0013D57A0A|nr:hypothetical protein [Fodinicola acaciae]
MSVSYNNEAVVAFQDFVAPYDTRSRQDDYTLLQDYLVDWLEAGSAVEYSGGNYETFLKVALHVADAVMKDPSILDYHPPSPGPYPDTPEEQAAWEAARAPISRPIEGILDPTKHSYDAFDRQCYEVVAFRRSNRGTGALFLEATDHRKWDRRRHDS